MPSNLKTWSRRLVEMQGCKTVADLVGKYGEPHHKVQQDGLEIWHYPLGVADGLLYSIHVSVWPDKYQAYMFFEPASLSDSPPQRAWWQFWKKMSMTRQFIPVARPGSRPA